MIREALLEMGEGYLIGNGPDPRRLLCQAGCQTRHSGRQVCGEREWSQATGEVSFPDWKVIEKKATRWSPFYLRLYYIIILSIVTTNPIHFIIKVFINFGGRHNELVTT
ncbi:hypothetical protein RI496_21140 [Aeromonas dhakensis]